MVGKNDSTFSSALGNMVEKCATSRDVQMTSTTAVSFVPERMVRISQIHLLVAILRPVPYLKAVTWRRTSLLAQYFSFVIGFLPDSKPVSNISRIP